MKSKKIITLVASATLASGIAIAIPSMSASADAIHYLNKPTQLVQFNKVDTNVNKDGTVTIKYKIVCNGKVLGTGSASGVPGTPDRLPIPAIPKGYTLKGITVNGSSAPDLSTSIPMNFPNSNTEVIYNVIKGVNTYTNSVRCTTASGKPISGVKLMITYSDTSEKIETTNSQGYAPTTNKYQVVNVTLLHIPDGYKLIGSPYQYIIASSSMLSDGATNTAVKADFKFSKTVVPKVATGEIKYTIQTASGTVLGGGGAKGVVGKKIDLNVKIPQGYKVVKYELSTGLTIEGLPTEITQAGETDYKIIVESTTPSKPAPVKSVLTIKEVGPDGTVYGQSGMNGFIGMQDKAVAPTLPKGFKLVNITCNGKVIDGLPKTLTEPNQTIIYHIERIAKPKPVVKIGKIAYKIITTDGKVLSSGSATGVVGSKDSLNNPNTPKGYKIISITNNGIATKGLPSTFTSDTQNIIYTVKSLQSTIQVTYSFNGNPVGSLVTSKGLIGGSYNISSIPKGYTKDYKVKEILINGQNVGTSLVGKKINSSSEEIVIKLEKIAKPAVKPTPKPIPKPVVKPTIPGGPTDGGDRPGGETTPPKPVIKPTPKPVIKPTPKPVVKPTPKPVVKPVAKPVVKLTPKPVVKPVAKPVAKPTYSVTANIIDKDTGKVISTITVNGSTGTLIYGSELNVPFGYKVDSVVCDGKQLPSIPSKIGDKNEVLNIIVSKPSTKPNEPSSKINKPSTKQNKPSTKPNEPSTKPSGSKNNESSDKTVGDRTSATNSSKTGDTSSIGKSKDKKHEKSGTIINTDNNYKGSSRGFIPMSKQVSPATGIDTSNNYKGSLRGFNKLEQTGNSIGSTNPKTGDSSEAPLVGLLAGSALALFILNKKYILR